MGEGAAGVVCEFAEERLGFAFRERSHFFFFLAIGRMKADLGEISGFGFWILGIRRHGWCCNTKKIYPLYSHVI